MKNRWLAATALLACVACKDDPPPTSNAAPTATAPEPEAKIKSVFTADPSGTAAPPGGQAPPPTGVFAPGDADKAHAKGAPATVEVIDKGAEPRAVLAAPVAPSDGATVQLLIGLRMGGGVLPNVVYTLKLASPKKEGDDEALPGEPTPLVATIADAALAEEQPGQIPPQLDKLITQVKGSRIATSVLPNGALQGVEVTYGDDLKEQGVRAFVDSIGDVLGYFFSPYPSEPIGVGGYWISHDRLSIQSLDLVRYRVTKVEKLTGDEVLLSVQLRHYLADGNISALVGKDQPGLAAGGFESVGQAQIARKTGSLFPITGEMRTPFTIVITMANNPQAEPQPVQFDVQARWLPSKGEAAEKAPTKGD